MKTSRLFSILGVLGAVALVSHGCGSPAQTNPPSDASADVGTDSPTGDDSPGTFGDDTGIFMQQETGPAPVCLTTQPNDCVHTCADGGTTTLSGTVYDPAGSNPLYGITVYVPQTTPSPITLGASCYSCSDLYTGSPLAYAVTDSAGKFTISGVPDGTNVPLVIQVGKWRMQYSVPAVTACQDNDATSAVDAGVLRLPKNHMEGDIPNIAIATGGADSLECLLHRIGLDESEYGPGPNTTGRISIYVGDNGSNTSPAAPVASASMWNSKADLMAYDMVLLTCEGHETTAMNQQALFDYAQSGGRAFASHFHYAWFNTGPFGAENLATWKTGTNDMGNINANVLTTLPGGGTFPRGVALEQWLGNVGALTNGELPIQAARHNADVTAANTASLPWIAADSKATPPNATEYLSFDTPFGTPPAEQCGRVVYSDLHVGAASADYGVGWSTVPAGSIVPTGCASKALSPQEKALEFMLFDLSACITPPDQGTGGVPPPPPPK